jgi:hypothetical protein
MDIPCNATFCWYQDSPNTIECELTGLGMHGSNDYRTMAPMPFLAFFPGIIAQSQLREQIAIMGETSADIKILDVGHPAKTEALAPRDNYEPTDPVDLTMFGPTKSVPLGAIALGRSGDKGANVNLGLFVQTDEEWDWLRTYLTRGKMQELMGDDWRKEYYIERIELPDIKAVHFVVYGPLSRGVSSSPLLDALGKGFAEFIRYRHVEVPLKFLET